MSIEKWDKNNVKTPKPLPIIRLPNEPLDIEPDTEGCNIQELIDGLTLILKNHNCKIIPMATESILELFEEKLTKAERWDMIPFGDESWFQRSIYWHELYESVKNKLDLLISNLRVREKCKNCNGKGYYKTPDFSVNPPDEYTIDCPYCHGTGTITRPATPEEVRELIEVEFSAQPEAWMQLVNGEYVYKLKSGATLFMKEKE